MIPASLNVERYQIHSEAFTLLFEQVVSNLWKNMEIKYLAAKRKDLESNLFGEIIVKILTGLSCQTDKELVKIARCVQHLGFEKVLPQQNMSLLFSLMIYQP